MNFILTPADIFGSVLEKDKSILFKLKSMIKDISFTEKPPFEIYKNIFDHCVSVHNRWSIDLIEYHLGEFKDNLKAYTQSIQLASKEIDIEYVLENLLHTKANYLFDKYNPLIKNTLDGKLINVLKNYTKELASLTLNKTDSFECKTAEELLFEKTELNNSSKILELGLGFDEVLSGGVREGELLLYIAPTGGGKTTLLLYNSILSALQGFKTLYVSLEISLDLIKTRLINFIYNNSFVDKSKLNNLYIKQFPAKSVTIEEIMNYAANLNVDVIILDYLTLVSFSNSSAIWYEIEEITAKFRGLLSEYKIIGISASQVNRMGIDKKVNNKSLNIVDINDVSFSMGMIFTSDYVITSTPVNSENFASDNANFILKVAKNRRGPTYLQPVNIDFAKFVIKPIVGGINVING